MNLALGKDIKVGLVAGARFLSNFNNEPPALVVKIPCGHQRGAITIKQPQAIAA